MKPLMINATDRITINTDNYQFYFNKLLTSKSIKIQIDVLTQETVKASDIKSVSNKSGIIATCLMICNYTSPHTPVKTAALVAAGASNILNRTNSLFGHGYGMVIMIKIRIREAASHTRIRKEKIRKIKSPGSQSSLIEKMNLAKAGLNSQMGLRPCFTMNI